MIVVAGSGPGNPKYLTLEVLESIRNFPIVIAFGRIKSSFKNIREDIIQVTRVDESLDIIDKNKEKDILILASGDPNFFGIVKFLKYKGVKVDKVLPGLSSFQYMMSKIAMPWQDARFISLHGRENSLEKIKDEGKYVVLTDKKHTPNFISKELKKIGVVGKMYVGFNLSYDNEHLELYNIGEDIEDLSPLAVVVIINEMD